MRGIFDNDEPEDFELDEPEERRHDTEVTLTTGAQLGIVFCLLLLCGLCFGLGYWVGHGRTIAAPATAANQPTGPTAAPDQEPLQGNGSLPKPSADAQVPLAEPSDESSGTPPTTASDTNPAPAQPEAAPTTPADQEPSPHETPAAPKATPPPPPPATAVRPAPEPIHTATLARKSEPEYEPSTRPTPATNRNVPPAYAAASGQYMVQIAAVSHSEDALVLVNALRNHGFAASAQRLPDGLLHVRIGPFATHEEASRMSARLLGEGYNAMVQP